MTMVIATTRAQSQDPRSALPVGPASDHGSLAQDMLLGISEGTSIHTNLRLTEGNIHVEIALRTRAITDKRLRRVWAI